MTIKVVLDQFLKVFNTSVDEFDYLGIDRENRIVLITKKDGIKVKFSFDDEIHWNLILEMLKILELEFMGFQHAVEGNSFWTYGVLGELK